MNKAEHIFPRIAIREENMLVPTLPALILIKSKGDEMTQLELFKKIKELGDEIRYLKEQNDKMQSSLSDLEVAWDKVSDAVEDMEDEGPQDDA